MTEAPSLISFKWELSSVSIQTIRTGLVRSLRFAGGDFVCPDLKVIKLEYILRLKIKRNDWLIADTCPQAANHYALF